MNVNGKRVILCVCVLVYVFSRHRGEVLDMGAHQEGAGASPPQPQKEENHLQLYYRLVSLLSFVHRLSDCVAAEGSASVWADGSVSEREREREKGGGTDCRAQREQQNVSCCYQSCMNVGTFCSNCVFPIKVIVVCS